MSLLADLWQDQPGRKCILAISSGGVKPLFVSGLEDAARVIDALRDKPVEVYFAPGMFNDGRRTADNLLGIGSFFLDIDCGEGKPYATWKHGLLALVKWLVSAQFYKPSYIVLSGGGLHVYWLLDSLHTRDEWLPVAQHLKQAVVVGGLQADPAVTADAARVLRVPGTKNYKRGGVPVVEKQLTDRRLSLQEFREALPAVGPIRLPGAAKPSGEWAVPEEYPKGDAPAIGKACAQMREVQSKQGKVAEPFWRAALSVLQRCDDHEAHIVEWSKGDERFNKAEALEKAARSGGPATCAHFNEVNPGGCVGCPHAGKITSPVQLSVAPIKATEPGKAGPQGTVGAFTVTDVGVYFKTPMNELGEGGELIKICSVPVWMEEVREKSRAGTEGAASQLVLHWRDLSGRPRQGELQQRDLYEPRLFKAWLADHNIISAVREVKLMADFISQYTADMLRKRGARQYYDTLGWHDNGFVVGEKIITAQGEQTALVQSGNPIGKLKAKGSLDGWTEGMKVLSHPDYWRHAFAVLAGFGSPLLEIVGVQSAVLSLVGPSGAGKTLSANAALSIYGDPLALSQGASATVNAWEKQLTCNRHVPYLLDEVTQYSTKLLTTFIYMAANGQGKASLTRNRETRTAGTWRLVPMITSNHPVMDFDQSEVEEAHRRRLLELTFLDAMDGEDGAYVEHAITQNCGVAAVPYLTAVCKVREHIPALFEAASRKLREKYNFPDANRFCMWTLAAAMVGGNLAKQLGLITFDVEAVVSRVAMESAGQATQTKSASDRAGEYIREWLAANSKRVCYWSGDKATGDLVDDPVARLDGKTVLVHRSELNKVLREARIPLSQLGAWWAAAQAESPKRARLAPGTPAVWCYVLRCDVVGFTEEV